MQKTEKEYSSLSIVVPVYKQEKTVQRNVKKIESSLISLGLPFEVIVVIDGIVDKSHENVNKINSKKIKVISYTINQGKGHAVRTGMLQAKGSIVGFIDGGTDVDPEGLTMLLNHMIWYDADIIVGSKLHPVSQVDYPLFRKILSWGYRNIIRFMFGLRVRDTQVGIKLFKRKVVEDVLPRLLIKRFAFDIEVLAVAYSRGFKRIYEAPVRLNFDKMSSITNRSFWRVVVYMLIDTLAVFYRLKILNYYNRVGKKKRSKRKS